MVLIKKKKKVEVSYSSLVSHLRSCYCNWILFFFFNLVLDHQVSFKEFNLIICG